MAAIFGPQRAALNAGARLLIIRKVKDTNLDLDLLRFFSALMETGALNRAACRLELSQPAASRALNHLRSLFNDKLFIKAGLGMIPTPRAVALAPAISEALERMEALVAPVRFDPERSRRLFRIAVVDNGFLAFVGRMLPEFIRQAPLASLEIRQLESDLFEQLREGRTDVAIFPAPALPPDYHQRELMVSDYVCLLRRGHPLLAATPEGAAPTLDAFKAYRRVSFKGQLGHEVRTGEQRALTSLEDCGPNIHTPYFLGVPLLLVDTDLLMVIPRPTAERFAALLPLAILPTPVPFAPFRPTLIWHDRVHADPGMQWFRSLFSCDVSSKV